jgi:phenylacetate-coenzyme A ligase PaaK-like adenylate-forming protein
MTTTASPPSELEPIETASAGELRALQLERLRWSLRHAYDNVPCYRSGFDAAGAHPDDCRDLSGLARFPFTTKASLRDNYPFGMLAVPREQVARVPRAMRRMAKITGRSDDMIILRGVNLFPTQVEELILRTPPRPTPGPPPRSYPP